MTLLPLRRAALLLILALAPAPLLAQSGGDPDAVGHSADGNYFDYGLGKAELPRLFFVRRADGAFGFDAFWSTKSALYDANYTLGPVTLLEGADDADRSAATLLGDGVTDTEAAEALAAGTSGAEVSRVIERASPEQVAEIVAAKMHYYFPVAYAGEGDILIDFSITRQLLFVMVSALLLLLMGLSLAGKYKKGIGSTTAPRGVWQNMLETIIVFIRDDVAKPSIGVKYRRYLPYLLSVFFFILIGNLLGLIPLGVTATSHIMVTAALALVTFGVTQFAGTKDYWAHIFNPPGVPGFVKPILVPIEFVGLFTKPLALAFRLFGNMVSGHLVIVSIIGLIFIFSARISPVVGGLAAPVAILITIFVYLLKIMVSFVQAYIFTMLSAVFIGMAAEEHHHDEHETVAEANHNRIPHGDGALKQGEHHLSDYLSPTPNHPGPRPAVTA
jgi:F-type H+-transporting ATPase subunit a